MRIKVSFFPSSEETAKILDLPASATVEQAITAAGIDEQEVSFIAVNGIKKPFYTVLAEGDKVRAYPEIIGG